MSRTRWGTLSIIVVSVVIADQISKWWMVDFLTLRRSVPVIGDFFRFSLALNPGGAFGTRLGGNGFYIITALIAAILLIFYLRSSYIEGHLIRWLPMGLILGGAIGNLIDRIRIGYVVDFLDVGVGRLRWPTFNIADSSIVVGLAFLLYIEYRYGKIGNRCPEGDTENKDRPISRAGGGASLPEQNKASHSGTQDRGRRERD